jgi:sulfite exporter TauE/SafE
MKPDSAVARRFLLVGATLLTVGIALGATGSRIAGAVTTLTGAALLIAGLHTFGRAGPDPGRGGDADSARNEKHV